MRWVHQTRQHWLTNKNMITTQALSLSLNNTLNKKPSNTFKVVANIPIHIEVRMCLLYTVHNNSSLDLVSVAAVAAEHCGPRRPAGWRHRRSLLKTCITFLCKNMYTM